jgi:hypothetical protein
MAQNYEPFKEVKIHALMVTNKTEEELVKSYKLLRSNSSNKN